MNDVKFADDPGASKFNHATLLEVDKRMLPTLEKHGDALTAKVKWLTNRLTRDYDGDKMAVWTILHIAVALAKEYALGEFKTPKEVAAQIREGEFKTPKEAAEQIREADARNKVERANAKLALEDMRAAHVHAASGRFTIERIEAMAARLYAARYALLTGADPSYKSFENWTDPGLFEETRNEFRWAAAVALEAVADL